MKQKDTKQIWKYIKSKRNYSIGVSPLKEDGQLQSGSSDKARILNSQFQSVFTKEDTSNIPTLTGQPGPSLPPLNIDVKGVEKLLSRIKVTKASGPDEISNRILQEMSTELAPPLAMIFSMSITSGQLPEDWRNTNISPIFKKGNREL